VNRDVNKNHKITDVVISAKTEYYASGIEKIEELKTLKIEVCNARGLKVNSISVSCRN